MQTTGEATAPRTTARTVALAAIVLALTTVGQLFAPTPIAAQAPPTEAAPAEAATTDWVKVSAGGGFTCGIRTSGRLFCWGSDLYGQLGNGAAAGDTTRPVQVAGGFTDWVGVDAGQTSVCARRRSGRLYCWGNDSTGQLGNDAALSQRGVPTEVDGRRTDWTAFSVGNLHACARRSNGRLFCWGGDGEGQLGNGAATGIKPRPVPVAGGFTDWTAVTAGAGHTCGRRQVGRLYCWGRNAEGQGANGTVTPYLDVPTEAYQARTDWQQPLAAGAGFTCSRRGYATHCAGLDQFGQLGNATAGSSAIPTNVVGIGDDIRVLTAGALHACALTLGSGYAFCWGSDATGQLGSTDTATFATEASGVVGYRSWSQLSAGDNHTCGITVGRRLFCWGDNASGQLGIGSFFERAVPTEVGAIFSPL